MFCSKNDTSSLRRGFTLVELLIVIVVIAILAAIVIVSYNGISQRAKDTASQAGAKQGFTKIVSDEAESGGSGYPANLAATGLPTDGETTYQYSVDNSSNTRSFCLTSSFDNISYYVTSANSTPTKGSCPGHIDASTGIASAPKIQTVTTASCPTTRIRVNDARDDRSYWVQKLSDGKCWMLTNLAYAGGGANTYNDVIPTGNGDSGTLSGPDNSGTSTYVLAKYYIPAGANPTSGTTNPSTSTSGTGQYGYLYNWCAAMGAQIDTGACNYDGTVVDWDVNKTICPAGWRLPTGGSGGEFEALNAAVNGGSTTSDAGLRSTWLIQRAGLWNEWLDFHLTNSTADYWSSTHGEPFEATDTEVIPSSYEEKFNGLAVRCIAK